MTHTIGEGYQPKTTIAVIIRRILEYIAIKCISIKLTRICEIGNSEYYTHSIQTETLVKNRGHGPSPVGALAYANPASSVKNKTACLIGPHCTAAEQCWSE